MSRKSLSKQCVPMIALAYHQFARAGRAKLYVGHTCWFAHNLSVKPTDYLAAGNIQAATESVVARRCLYRLTTCQNRRFTCMSVHTCVNDSRDMCCATASTIRQYMEHSSARILCNPFVQCLLQRLVLVWMGGSSARPSCGHVITSSVQYHQ